MEAAVETAAAATAAAVAAVVVVLSNEHSRCLLHRFVGYLAAYFNVWRLVHIDNGSAAAAAVATAAAAAVVARPIKVYRRA